MAKKNSSGKVKKKLVQKQEVVKKATSKQESPEENKPKYVIPERVKEKDPGFGVIKIVVGVIFFLVLGITALGKYKGMDKQLRGDKAQGEACESYKECTSGFVCMSYGDAPSECLQRCDVAKASKDCPEKHQCVSATYKRSRKRKRVRSVCVANELVK